MTQSRHPARSTGGALGRTAFLFAALLAPKPSTFAQASLVVEDLGPIIESATLERHYVFQAFDGDAPSTHLVLMYSGTAPFQIVDVPLDSGDPRVLEGLPGRPAACLYRAQSGKLYISSGDPGFLMEYTPRAGASRKIGALADKAAQTVVEGDDGAIYIGESIRGHVERYSPTPDQLVDLGIMDDPGPPYYRYAYSLGADTRYVYAAIGQQPWYLVVFDRATRRQNIFWKASETRGVTVQRDGGGRLLAQHCAARAAGPDCRWYLLKDGQPYALPPGDHFLPPTAGLSGGLLTDLSQSGRLFSYEIDLTEALPDTSNRGRAVVRWRRVETAAWHSVNVQLRMRPYAVKRLAPIPGSSLLLGFTEFYGPVFTYNPLSRAITILGRTQASLYDLLWDGAAWHLAGYPAVSLRYDPAQVWTANANAPLTGQTNPAHIPVGFGKYHYRLAQGAEGSVFVGAHHERDSDGGELGWYKFGTAERGSLRQPFLYQDVRDLIAVNHGAEIVYSGSARAPQSEGKLFVLDAVRKVILRELTPLPGSPTAGKIVEVAPGQVLGVAGRRVYSIDIRSGRLAYDHDLGGEAFRGIRSYDQRLILGPDGRVWLYIDNAISRIDPKDGSVRRVTDANPPGNLLFAGKDLYVYGQQNLRLIRDAATP